MDFQFAPAVNEQMSEDDAVPFTLNVTDLDEDGNPLEEQRYEQDDYSYVAQLPTPELLSLVMSDANGGDFVPRVASVWLYFENTLSPEDYQHLRSRVLNRRSGIGYEHISQVMMGLIKEFSGFPTKRRAGSSPSPRTTGQRSTGRQPGPGSTRSRSTAVAG